MRRRLNILAVGAVTATAVVIFFTTAVRALYYAPEPELSPEMASSSLGFTIPATSTVSLKSIPTSLIIPEIGVQAKVRSVGLGKAGNMAVPPNYTDVGWYRYGPTPGEWGSAVFDGHLDNGFGVSAVFKNLGNLKIGSDVYVERTDGSRLHFKVTKVESYAIEDIPLKEIFNTADDMYLNLITCDGAWSAESLSYDKRLVVYTKRAG